MSHDPRVAASVLARLRNEAQRLGEEFNPLLTRYVGLRLLHRVATSPYSQGFLLKGATMFLVWLGALHRPTRDIDLLGAIVDEPEALREKFRLICEVPCSEDGVRFDSESIRVSDIREGQAYGGLRVDLVAYIGKARIPVQVDIGFGDAVTPGPIEVVLPTVLTGIPQSSMGGYSVETVVAEKFHAMIVFGIANSRMKDFEDVATLAIDAKIDHEILRQALVQTFMRRRTMLPDSFPDELFEQLRSDPLFRSRWQAYVKRNRTVGARADLDWVLAQVTGLVARVLNTH